jgi:hypothetical protein
MKIEKQTTYSYSLGLDLSLGTHIDDLLAFFSKWRQIVVYVYKM